MAAMAGGGMALEFAGGMMNRNAGISLSTLRRRGRQAIGQTRASDALFAGLERSELLKGQAGERQGYQTARNALNAGAQVAKQGLAQRGIQNQAATEQSVVSRGLGGTSTGAQAFAGVGNQTAMQMAQIDTQLAQAFADLGLEEGAMLGQQGRERLGLAAKNRGFNQELENANFGILTSGSITR